MDGVKIITDLAYEMRLPGVERRLGLYSAPGFILWLIAASTIF